MELNKIQYHSRTIIHIEIDCFYAQVELLKRPRLQNEPVGVKQKNTVVDCNYLASRCGVMKLMPVTEALEKCPNLMLFNSKDLYTYRQVSNQIHLFLLSYTRKVEKNGFDENFLDVSELVKEKEKKNEIPMNVRGHCVGDITSNCACGCHQRLIIGSQIAHEIRGKLKNELGLTCCCGISYNKLLAKVCCSAHKPNQQTTLFPNGTLQFMLNLNQVERIPGLGEKTQHLLKQINVRTVKDLQEVNLKDLKKIFKNEEAVVNLKDLSRGICSSVVKHSGKFNSISLEDGFRKMSVESDVKETFRTLLQRLMTLVEEDGRIPMTVKVTIRKHDSERKTGNKETKQSPVPTCLFSHPVGQLSEESTSKLLNIIMGLFCKIVNVTKPFHVTLLGLAFSKFHEKVSNCSIASFLLKKRDLSVQSLTTFVSNETSPDLSNVPLPSHSKSESDSDAEPSPKKTKLDIIIKKRKLSKEGADLCSPSKLRVENLNLNGDGELSQVNEKFPTNIKQDMFCALSQDIHKEIMQELKITYPKPKMKFIRQSLMHSYCVQKNSI